MKVTFCDRCGDEAATAFDATVVVRGRPNGVNHYDALDTEQHFELCGPCSLQLKAWKDKKPDRVAAA